METSVLGIFSQMATLFAVIAVGYACKKLGVFDTVLDGGLSRLVLSVTLPAMIVGSVVSAEELPGAAQIGGALLCSCLAYAVMVALALAFTAALRVRPGERGAYRFMMVFGNVGFLGFPVVSAVYGPDALIYAAIFNLPFNFLSFTVGAWFIASDVAGAAAEKVTWRTFTTPVIVCCLVAIALALAGVHGVPVVGDALQTLGGMTTPAAMLVVGSQLANLPVRRLLGTPRLWACSAVRLLVMPAAVLGAMLLVRADALLTGILVVTTAMPVANMGTMLSLKYGGDGTAVAQGTFVTTLFSMATIPLLVALMGALG